MKRKLDFGKYLLVSVTLVLSGVILLGRGNRLAGKTHIYENKIAGISIELPSDINIFEQEANHSPFKGGEIYFSRQDIDKEIPYGMVIVYSKPGMEKGGACVDENGEPAYKEDVIAGQKVLLCEVDGFKMEYFKNPNEEIEYWIGTIGVGNKNDIQYFEDLVKRTLKFI